MPARATRLVVVLACLLAPSGCVQLGLLAPKCPKEGGPAWVELKSQHFVLDTDLSPEDATRALVDLERLRLAMLELVWGGWGGPPDRIEVVSLYSRAEALEYFPDWAAGRVGADEFGRVAIVYGTLDRGPSSALTHELAHQLSAHFYPRQPRWLGEGLASYLESVTVSADGATAQVGAPTERLLRLVEQRGGVRRIPVAELFQQAEAEPDAGLELERFYATAQLVVHYLVNKHEAELSDLLARLTTGASFERAWKEAFGELTPEKLDEELGQYLRVGGSYVVSRRALPTFRLRIERTTLSDARVHAVRGRLHLIESRSATGDRRETQRERALVELAEALRQDPRDGLALVLRALASPDDALALARLAVKDAPGDWRAWYVLAKGLADGAGEAAEQDRALEKLAALAPDEPRALRIAALGLTGRGKAARALPLAERASALAPFDASAWEVRARVELAAGKCDAGLESGSKAVDLLPDEQAWHAPGLREWLAEMKRRCAPEAKVQPEQHRPEVTATADPAELGLQDTVLVTFALTRPSGSGAEEVHLPDVPDFEVVSRSQKPAAAGLGPSPDWTRTEHSLRLKPRRAGTLTIPPAKFIVDGAAYETAPLRLRVVPGGLGHTPGDADGIPTAAGDPPDLLADLAPAREPEQRDLFLRSFVDKRQVFVGEQLAMAVYLFARVGITGVDAVRMPRFDGFWAEEVAAPRQISGELRNIDGVVYRAYLIRQVALFPFHAGSQSIGAAALDVALQSSTADARQHCEALPVRVDVLPLPARAGQPVPAMLDVGEWEVSAALLAVAPGEPVVLRVTLEGSGNLHLVSSPALPATPGLAVSVPREVETVAIAHARFGGRRVAEYEVFARQAGTFEIPSIAFSYFSPSRKGVATAQTKAFQVQLEPATTSPPPAPAAPSAGDAPSGLDLVVALDLSPSMRALDIVPGDRLDAARSFIRRLVQPRPKASVGLVGFAGEAQGLSPLSPDRGAFESALDSARPGQLPDGTAIGNALASALDRLCPSGLAACRSNRRNKAIVLITDGGNNAGQISPLDAAELARLGGARVVAVLVGKGGKVDYPVVDDSGASTVRQVDFPVDPELVRAIASATGGSAFEVRERSDFEAVLPKVARHLDHAGSTPASSQKTFSDAEAARILGAVRRVEAATRGQR